MDITYIELNRQQRERLRKIVEQSSDEQLSRKMPGGWTVSAMLAHCGFWDRYAVLQWEIWERGGFTPLPVDVESLNAACFPAWLVIPPRIAADQALASAQAIDLKVEGLDPLFVEKFLAEKYGLWRLHTYEHRGEHLNEIEHVLSDQA